MSARWCDRPDSPRLPTEGVPRPPTAAERVRGVAATYDADGDLATESLPGGYTLTVGEDETGAMTSRVYTRDSDSAVVASDTVDRSVQDEEVADSDTSGTTRSRKYGYDMAGRLARADETNSDGSCTRRDYAFDKNSNRKTLTTATSDVGTDCSSTGATTTSYTYDSANRLETTGTVYDAFGRTTTQATGATVGYYANDLVRQQTANSKRQTWNLDAAGRLASWTTETQGSDNTWTQTEAKTNHFSGDDDTPDWTAEDTNGTITRSVLDLDDDLGAITSGTGDTVLQLTDVHGDVTVQLPLDTSKSAVALAFDEFGNLEGDAVATRYGWLGAAQRASDTVTGATLMGVRLYDPTSGRFLSTDPVTEPFSSWRC